MLRAFADAFRIKELRDKIFFTLILLAVYRLGAAIPTPGVDVSALQNNLSQNNALGGVLGILGLVSGGNLEQFSVFALGVLPYITASIVMQILTTAVPQLEAMQKEGPEGAKRINQYTRVAAIVLGGVQAVFFANLLQAGGAAIKVGWNPVLFQFVAIATQCAGIAFTMWLGERITEYGVGNGISMIIFAGIVHRFPIEIQQTLALINTGQVDLLRVIAFFAMVVVVIGAIVMVQQGERRIPVQYARKVAARGAASSAAQSSYIPLKINTAGVIPIIFASSILQLVQLIPQVPAFQNQPWTVTFSNLLNFRSWTGLTFEVLLIVLFTYFYTTISFDPKRVAENLREQGGFVPGVRPGADTQGHLERISSRITFWGALFLAALAVVPTIVQNLTSVTTFPLAGTTLLIVVGVALDTLKQLESQLAIRNYDGFLQKGKLRGRGGFQQ
jgi:preprotein translocase subunit SecY